MADKTYYAAADLTIERLSIRRGDELGHGDVPPAGENPSGTFKPVKGLERIEPGHIQAGLETGRIVTRKPAPLPHSDSKGKRGRATSQPEPPDTPDTPDTPATPVAPETPPNPAESKAPKPSGGGGGNSGGGKQGGGKSGK